LFAAADLAQGEPVGEVVDVEALADLGEPGLGGPPFERGPAFLHQAVLREPVLAAFQRGRQQAQGLAHVAELAEAGGQEVADRAVRLGDLLRDVADPGAGAAVDGAGGGWQFPGEHAQQGRLAGPVGADDADPVAGAEHQVEAGEEQITVVGAAE